MLHRQRPPRVLHVASEVFPLAKTGGLADVIGALARALSDDAIDVRVLLPAYPVALGQLSKLRTATRFDDLLGCGPVRLLAATLPGTAIPIWLVDCPTLYQRPGGIYQDSAGNDWHDNALRFALLNHVAAAIAAGETALGWQADLVHCHDWHASLVPLLLAGRAAPRPPTLLTVHNLAYQGIFSAADYGRLGLPADDNVRAALEYYGQLSFLKAGIVAADALNTVSPTYAREILTPEYGCGLDGLLRSRAESLMGIMNGADYGLWDPAHDPYLPANFAAPNLAPKRACKIAVQNELELEPDAERPLVAFLSRLAHQKMPDIVLEALPALFEEGIQFALVAEGERAYDAGFRELASRYPGRAAIRLSYNEPLAHRLLAGADILLHPSRFEPCGLTPIYAMRYGTVPVVRRSGGMLDSVVDAIEHTIDCNIATGFSFEQPDAAGLVACLHRTLRIFRQPQIWRRVQHCAMRQNFGWAQPAATYAAIYRSLMRPEELLKENGAKVLSDAAPEPRAQKEPVRFFVREASHAQLPRAIFQEPAELGRAPVQMLAAHRQRRQRAGT